MTCTCCAYFAEACFLFDVVGYWTTGNMEGIGFTDGMLGKWVLQRMTVFLVRYADTP